MAATEDISFRVALDDGQAQAGLEGLRTQATGVAVAADSAAGGIGSISKSAERLNTVAGSASTAISGIGSAIGGVSSSASSALGAVANLAQALTMGGPLAVGIVAAGTGVAWLTTKFMESQKAAEQAAKAEVEAVQKTANEIENITRGVEGRIADALGLDEVAVKLGQLEIKVKETNQVYLDMTENKGDYLRSLMDMGKSFEDAEDEYQKKLEETEKRLDLLAGEYTNAQAAADEYGEKIAILNRLEANKKRQDQEAIDALMAKAKATGHVAKATAESAEKAIAIEIDAAETLRELGFEESAIQAQVTGEYARNLAERERLQKEAEDRRLEAARLAMEERIRLEKEEANLAREMRKEQAREAASIAMTVAGIAASSSQQLIDDLITGQENAFERFFAGIMKQAGTVLIGKGIEAIGVGVGNLVMGNPAGAGQIATGSALVGAGLGLGGIGTGIEQSLVGGGGAAQVASRAPATTSTPMGAGRISTGSVGDGGPGGPQTHTYVFNAPVFGDQNRSARHVALLQRRARRDLLMA